MTNKIKDSNIPEQFDLMADIASDYIIKIAIIQFPFLALPFIKQVFTIVMKKVLNIAKNEGKIMITFKLIDLETEEEKNEYERAINNLRNLPHDAPKEVKDEAIKNAKDRLSRLIRFP